MIHAAGILILDKQGCALFLKRGPGGDAPGYWCLPGGKIEEGEDALTAAVRETEEETGFKVDPKKLVLLTRRIKADALLPQPVQPTDGVPAAADVVDFTTFLLRDCPRFEAEPDAEHVGYAWVPFTDPPVPLHPGCAVTLARLSMDELGVARAIAAGDLTSPQRYQNIWLFDIRITGTGASYRSEIKDPKTKKVVREEEYVWRDTSIFTTPDFLARCNGLPVVWQHPDGPTVDIEFLRERVVGTVMLPYLKGDEVWGIAKIYDDAAAEVMADEKLSTSPGVLILDSASERVALGDGPPILVEGNPVLLDHIAICAAGVWDKGGEPSGVSVARKDHMTETVAATAAQDAAADNNKQLGEKLDSIITKLDSAHARLDAMEKKDAETEEEKLQKEREKEEGVKDAKKKRHDAARKDRFGKRKDGESFASYRDRHDADEKAMCDALRHDGEGEAEAAKASKDARHDAEEEEKRVDASFEEWAKEEGKEKEHKDRRHDAQPDPRLDSLVSENRELSSQVKALTSRLDGITREVPAEERNALAGAQARADTVMAMFGQRASAPLPGETSLAYRKRLLTGLLKHSPQMKDARLDEATGVVLEVIEKQVYSDAADVARRADTAEPGILIPVYETDAAGRRITKFNGDNLAWMLPYMRGGQVGIINRKPSA